MGLVAKAFQDIITFSRASSGTYVNSNGYITNSSVLNYLTYSNAPENAAWTKSNSFVQQNLLTYSQEFDNAAWIVPSGTIGPIGVNSTAAPDGTLTADTVSATSVNATFWQTYSPSAAGIPYTGSIWLKRKTGSGNVQISSYDSSTFANVDLSSGGWVRATQTNTSTIGTKAVGIRIVTSGDEVYVWGAQLVQGSVPGDYRATTSAALPCLYADYNGVLRARKLCEDAAVTTTHWTFQSITTVASAYTVSEVMKAGERTWALIRIRDSSGNDRFAWFNLAAGTIGAVQTNLTASMVSLGNGWYRCSVTVSAAVAAANPCVFGPVTGDGVATYTGDGSSGIYIADAQLNDGSSALAYYDTTASAYNAPRFDYDPVTLAAKGLLVEEQRVNLLLQSNDFLTSWTPTNITRTLNSTLSPSGNVDGVKIAATAAAATQLLQAATVAATAATGSVYVKQGTGATVANQFTLRNNTTSTNLIIGTLNYSTGVFTYSTGSTGVVVTNVGNGWWRIAMTATAGITAGDLIAFYPGWSGNVATAGDFLYAYGAQLEAGAFATSYIPTVASQVTRAADVASVNTLSPWYNSVAGTFYAEWNGIGSFYAFATADATNSGNESLYAYSPSNYTVQAYKAAVLQANIASSVAQGTLVKSGIAFAANDFAVSYNGAAAVTDATYSQPTMDKLRLGSAANAPVGAGWLRRITYYPRRLTNAELQTLTTL